MARRHLERHRTTRIGWLRAAVLGANDGIVSTASLVLGVAAAGASAQAVLVAGVAGLVADGLVDPLPDGSFALPRGSARSCGSSWWPPSRWRRRRGGWAR